MNSLQIEGWALRVIDSVKASQPNEDFRVELKREWLDPKKAARRIAGHANAARGEQILWLIGVDQTDGVIGADIKELASWYPSVISQFDEVAPALTDLNVPVEGKTIVALLFDTDRAPYVVKSFDGGTIQREVPWREATGLRSAHRSDLIRLLAPLQFLPDVEVIDTEMSLTETGTTRSGNHIFAALNLKLELYIFPKNNNRVVIPFHRCKASFEVLGVTSQLQLYNIWLSPSRGQLQYPMVPSPPSLTITGTNSEVLIDGPGRLAFEASAGPPTLPDNSTDYQVQVTVLLLPANAERPVVLSITRPYPSASEK